MGDAIADAIAMRMAIAPIAPIGISGLRAPPSAIRYSPYTVLWGTVFARSRASVRNVGVHVEPLVRCRLCELRSVAPQRRTENARAAARLKYVQSSEFFTH